MKRLLLLLVAFAVFAACDDDPIDYSTWTTEELLATPGGVDYLIDTIMRLSRKSWKRWYSIPIISSYMMTATVGTIPKTVGTVPWIWALTSW